MRAVGAGAERQGPTSAAPATMRGMYYRETTRVGPCYHCKVSTVFACMSCENFVCPDCNKTHDNYSDHEQILKSKPGG